MKNLILGGEEIIIGDGSIKYLSRFKNLKVFIVTGGSSMFNNGAICKIQSILEDNNCSCYVHSGVKSDPNLEDVLIGLERMKEFHPEILIAVGGGSAMDAAKVMALLFEYPDIDLMQISSIKLPEKRKKLKMIFIPSTSGTASEVTKAAVLTFKEKNRKIGLKTNAFIPDVAILDGNLTLSMPKHIVAETGMDALTHAVECYINKGLDPFTEVISKGAVEGIFKNLLESYEVGSKESRENMHYYQCMAGLAFANVGLGMAHGISHAIGAEFNLSHGLINAIALPYVLKFNSRDKIVNDKLNKLAQIIMKKDFIEEVVRLNEKLSIPKSFKEAGITEEDFNSKLQILVDNSMEGSTKVNPVKPTKEEMYQILSNVFNGEL
ncbi:iron-containing alcohol dehydrogenase [uncultured Clostridium sp.]|uniref:iron-containing alcohol dehydrogenase n=1 Tax=uncultured Clostridium sp. TaxID=59620 RepID=UPI0028F049D4|nr:iron-containing alcohol dehydrogenase [uncultured Clostridium sp.]